MKKNIIVLLLLFFSVLVKGQDFGIWYEIDGHLPIKKLNFSVTSVLRSDENGKNVYESYIEPEVIYNFSPFIAAGIGYKSFIKHPFEIKGLTIYDVITTIPINRVYGRIRYRAEFNMSENIMVSRCRFQLNYRFKKWKPYASSEIFFLHEGGDLSPKKWRHIVGIQYNNGPAIEYGRREILNGVGDLNVLSLKYTILFL